MLFRSEELEAELDSFKHERPMSLVLPSLYSELSGPALGHIVEELSKVSYLDEIVVGLDRANENEYRHAIEYFGKLGQHHRILWNDGPRLQAIDQELRKMGLAPIELGKGRNVWYCFGYVLGSGRGESVALHDCDIVTYERELLARLIYPVAHPTFSYAFCKGYYSRIGGNAMGGRVSRLFVTPLLRTLTKVCGSSEFITYLDSFRYPLAGEFAVTASLARSNRIPSDWGLEVGTLEIGRAHV